MLVEYLHKKSVKIIITKALISTLIMAPINISPLFTQSRSAVLQYAQAEKLQTENANTVNEEQPIETQDGQTELLPEKQNEQQNGQNVTVINEGGNETEIETTSTAQLIKEEEQKHDDQSKKPAEPNDPETSDNTDQSKNETYATSSNAEKTDNSEIKPPQKPIEPNTSSTQSTSTEKTVTSNKINTDESYTSITSTSSDKNSTTTTQINTTSTNESTSTSTQEETTDVVSIEENGTSTSNTSSTQLTSTESTTTTSIESQLNAETDNTNDINTSSTDINATTSVENDNATTEPNITTTSSLSTEDDENTNNELNASTTINTSTSTADDSQNNEPNENNHIENNSGRGGQVNSGDAYGIANVVNLVNTTFLDSEGFLSFLNNLNPMNGNVLLNNLPLQNEGSCGENCTLNTTNGSTTVNISNETSIENNIDVQSNTGENNIEGSSENAQIESGNANAIANVVNIANTNIVRSKYFLVVINNLNDWIGDLVLPGKAFFRDLLRTSDNEHEVREDAHEKEQEQHAVSSNDTTENKDENSTSTEGIETQSATASSSDPIENNEQETTNTETAVDNTSSSSPLVVSTANSAQITNSVSTTAVTGSNTIEGSGTIQTGHARSLSNITNTINQTLIGGSSLYILVNVLGNWSGNVFGLPEGLTWKYTPNGIVIYTAEDENSPNKDSSTSSISNAETNDKNTNCETCKTSIETTNEAHINNNINVYALTGQNMIRGDGVIETGNANAVSNIINVANTNIIGRNWFTAIVNVAGDWNGHLSFGQPNIWVGSRIETSQSPAVPGTEINMFVDVLNKGDADANNLIVEANLENPSYLTITDTGGGTLSTSSVTWNIALLEAGASTTMSFKGIVNGNVPSGANQLNITTHANGDEPDAQNEDNEDALALLVKGNPVQSVTTFGGGGSGGTSFEHPLASQIVVTKTSSASNITLPGNTVTYTITIENKSNESIYNSKVHDILLDPDGYKVAENTWELDEVFPREAITISYDTEFMTDTTLGTYTNSAFFEGTDWKNQHFTSKNASYDVRIGYPIGGSEEQKNTDNTTSSEQKAEPKNASSTIATSTIPIATSSIPEATSTAQATSTKKTTPIIAQSNEVPKALAAEIETSSTEQQVQTQYTNQNKTKKEKYMAALLSQWNEKHTMFILLVLLLLLPIIYEIKRRIKKQSHPPPLNSP